jgi:hypothetical protein
MKTEEDLISKLMISKAIMDKHNGIKRGNMDDTSLSTPMVEDYQPVAGNYNIPQELLSEVQSPPTQSLTKQQGPPTKDRILSSKLPDEIKKLMMENPIVQPAGPNVGISNELAEKASKLMGIEKKNQVTPIQKNMGSSIDPTELKNMMREALSEVLEESGLLIESTTNSKEMIQIKIGKHIFEGTIKKVKKTL